MKQTIAFNRKKIYVSGTESKVPSEDLMRKIVSISNELKEFGYSLSPRTILLIKEEDLVGIHEDIIPELQDRFHTIYGKDFKILYPGFPKQVIEADEFELWENARSIYDGDMTVDKFIQDNPFYTEAELKEISDAYSVVEKPLEPLTNDEFMKIPIEIVSTNNSISDRTKEELIWFLENYPDLELPERIPFKETLCLVMSKRSSYKPSGINDILRYGIYIMGGDPALIHTPKEIISNFWDKTKKRNPEWRNFTSLSRKERRHILSLIDNMVQEKGLGGLINDAKAQYGSWMLLNERIHPGNYAKLFPKAIEFFKTLLTPELCKKYKTWNSKVQEMYDNGENIVDIAKFISSHPGELTRRLDSLIRRGYKEGKEGDVFEVFLTTSGMSNKTLLELISYYDHQLESDGTRMIRLKGSSQLQLIPPKDPLNKELIEITQTFICRKLLSNISNRIIEKDLEGKFVVLDPNIRNIPIPVGMRSAEDNIVIGTKYSIPENQNYVLFYTQWFQDPKGENSEDLDLHAYLCNSDGSKSRNIGWNTGLTGENLCAIHSGDVLNTPGNCQESVLIDIEKCLKAGYKYVIADILNFKGRSLQSLPCWYGYKFEEKFGSIRKNTITKNPEYQARIPSATSGIIAFMIDLEERTIMMLSSSIDTFPTFNNANASYQKSLIKFFKANRFITSYDIMKQYYTSRGAEILDAEPVYQDEEEEAKMKELIEKVWTENEVANDYIKVLQMIGE